MTTRLRYLLIATHVPGSGAGGGIVRYTVDLATALSRREDIELHLVVTPGGAGFFGRTLPAARLHPVRAAATPARSLLERAGVLPGLRRDTVDVVHGVKHLVPRRAHGATTVLTVHDMVLLDRPADFPAAKRFLLRRPYLRSIRDAEVLACVSEATRQRLLDHVPSARPRTAVVPLAVSAALADVVPEPVATLAGRRFALVVGDSSPRKNLGLAVDTWPRVRDAVPGAVLAVVGPPDWGRIQRGSAWDDEVAAGAIRSLGNVTDATLRWCYENCEVVLCPSLVEGFGLPAAEAVRFGAAVVRSEDPAMSEAAAGRGAAVPAGDRAGWVRAVVDAFHAPRPGPPADSRSWDEVAEETVAAIRLSARR